MTTTPKLPEVIAFLKGEGPLDGVWFGEPHPSGKPYWWRTLLPASEAPVAWRAYGPGRWANSWQDGKPTADDLEYSRTRGYAITYAYARAESAAPASVPEGVRELVEAIRECSELLLLNPRLHAALNNESLRTWLSSQQSTEVEK
jgi:hypothetical protein